jgi:hypothetical protein
VNGCGELAFGGEHTFLRGWTEDYPNTTVCLTLVVVRFWNKTSFAEINNHSF